MTSSNKPHFSSEVFHLHITYHMALHDVVSTISTCSQVSSNWKAIITSFISFWIASLLLLVVAILFVRGISLFDSLWYPYSELVHLLVVSLIQCANYPCLLLQGVRHPPGKSRFIFNPSRYGIFCYCNWIGFFEVGESFPSH